MWQHTVSMCSEGRGQRPDMGTGRMPDERSNRSRGCGDIRDGGRGRGSSHSAGVGGIGDGGTGGGKRDRFVQPSPVLDAADQRRHERECGTQRRGGVRSHQGHAGGTDQGQEGGRGRCSLRTAGRGNRRPRGDEGEARDRHGGAAGILRTPARPACGPHHARRRQRGQGSAAPAPGRRSAGSAGRGAGNSGAASPCSPSRRCGVRTQGRPAGDRSARASEGDAQPAAVAAQTCEPAPGGEAGRTSSRRRRRSGIARAQGRLSGRTRGSRQSSRRRDQDHL